MSELSKVVIVCPPERFPTLKSALREIGISGMTVTRAEGCGLQGGRTEYYRGNTIEIDLLPKTKVELVIATSMLDKVLKTAKQALYSGKIGDGKIFVYDVKEVLRISTGATGIEALNLGSEDKD